MPITQERMILLINAAKDYEQAFVRAIEMVKADYLAAKRGQMTWEEAMIELTGFITTGMLAQPTESSKIIALEAKHFRQSQHRNNRAAQRAAEKRTAEKGGYGKGKRRQDYGPSTDFVEYRKKRTTAPGSLEREAEFHTGPDWESAQVTQRRALPLDPSLAEEEEESTLDQETIEEIERASAAAVASHPGTVGTEAEGVVPDVDDEADEGTELDRPGATQREDGD